jgi:PAS domain S-box-containing protein
MSRTRAPKRARPRPTASAPPIAAPQAVRGHPDSDMEVRRLLQELQVHQVELESQNAELRRVRLELEGRNERLELALESNRIGAWDLDLHGHTWHRTLIHDQLFGYQTKLPTWTFETFLEHVLPDDRTEVERTFQAATAAHSDWSVDCRIRRADGVIRDIWAVGVHGKAAAGEAVRMHGLVQDVTDRKRWNEQFRLAIEAAPTGMLMTDRCGNVILVNTQIERLFGYARVELLGRPIEMLIPERFRTRHPNFRDAFFGEPKARDMGAGRELYGLRKDGSEVPIEIGLTPFHTSVGDFVISSVVDISQRRELDRLGNEFISTVSHELRTPLTSICGSLGLLQSGAMGELSDKAAAMVRIAYQNSGRLVRIINDILDIGKIEAGRLDIHATSVTVADLVQQSVEANSGFAAKHQVRFVFDQAHATERVLADAERFMQVMTNLLSNAAKFSPPGADVLIRIVASATTVRVEVEDHGPGIPEEFRGRIFEKFAQADSSTARRFEGTGLGLSITRKLVEAMGGTVGFSTVVGQGTIFHVDLPRIDAAPEDFHASELSETATYRVLRAMGVAETVRPRAELPRLLHVDDDRDLVTVLGVTLAGRAEVVPAQTLRRAESLLREGNFDLIVLDQVLPDGNGVSLVPRIPQLLGRSVPIVILSATEVPADVRRQVTAALMKSPERSTQIANTIMSHVPSKQAGRLSEAPEPSGEETQSRRP